MIKKEYCDQSVLCGCPCKSAACIFEMPWKMCWDYNKVTYCTSIIKAPTFFSYLELVIEQMITVFCFYFRSLDQWPIIPNSCLETTLQMLGSCTLPHHYRLNIVYILDNGKDCCCCCCCSCDKYTEINANKWNSFLFNVIILVIDWDKQLDV